MSVKKNTEIFRDREIERSLFDAAEIGGGPVERVLEGPGQDIVGSELGQATPGPRDHQALAIEGGKVAFAPGDEAEREERAARIHEGR